MFDITSSKDFYRKLVADYDDFMSDQTSSRLAMNCIITAYHLHEWVWGDWVKGDKALQGVLGVSDKKSFVAWIDGVMPWFSVVQTMANGTKHFIRNSGIETARISGYGQGPYGVGPYGQGYLLIDYGEAAGNLRYQPAAHLLEAIVRFWRDFFRAYHPDKDIPVSPHHAVP